MKRLLFYSSIILLFFCSCQSKLDKTLNKAYNLADEYIEALDNAKSKDEIYELKRVFESKVKLLEQELEELEKSGGYSLKELQDAMQSEKLKNMAARVKETERNAKKRYK